MFRPRFVGRLGLADAATVANAMLGFVAVVAATVDLGLTARLILFAAATDALDGLIARRRGSTRVGEYLDSLADVASFCVAPAAFVYSLASGAWPGVWVDPLTTLVAVGIPAMFVASGVIRLGLYTAYDLDVRYTQGVQTTLAANILAVAYLAGVSNATVVVTMTAIFVYMMLATVPYPELGARDAWAMGSVQLLTIFFPRAFGGIFPLVLLLAALSYLVFGPWLYDYGLLATAEGKRS